MTTTARNFLVNVKFHATILLCLANPPNVHNAPGLFVFIDKAAQSATLVQRRHTHNDWQSSRAVCHSRVVVLLIALIVSMLNL